jgi:putative GTP pyrophosphokinase
MSKKIYIADDIDNIRFIVKTVLEKEGYAVTEFSDGDSLLAAFIKEPSDLVLLDVMMPGSNGFVICKELRKISGVPIIMLTGRNSDLDYATGRDLGCDAFLPKPLEPKELVKQVKAIFGREEYPADCEAVFSGEEAKKLDGLLRVYKQGLDTLMSRVQSIYEGLGPSPNDNPIERVCGRLKSHSSIAQKLSRRGLELTAENAIRHLTDIAGIRIISSYINDIPLITELIKAIPSIEVTGEKDYIREPKPSGYRSRHVIVSVPVSDGRDMNRVTVEIQIRTGGMDYWATLEHKVRYKYKGHIPQHLSDELVICANKINEVDERMFLVHDIISLINS